MSECCNECNDLVIRRGKQGLPGADGDSAFVYIAYASNDSGADFTLTFDPALNYIGIINTTTEIVSPMASDFAGKWFNYKGATGNNGTDARLTLFNNLDQDDCGVSTNNAWVVETIPANTLTTNGDVVSIVANVYCADNLVFFGTNTETVELQVDGNAVVPYLFAYENDYITFSVTVTRISSSTYLLSLDSSVSSTYTYAESYGHIITGADFTAGIDVSLVATNTIGTTPTGYMICRKLFGEYKPI